MPMFIGERAVCSEDRSVINRCRDDQQQTQNSRETNRDAGRPPHKKMEAGDPRNRLPRLSLSLPFTGKGATEGGEYITGRSVSQVFFSTRPNRHYYISYTRPAKRPLIMATITARPWPT